MEKDPALRWAEYHENMIPIKAAKIAYSETAKIDIEAAGLRCVSIIDIKQTDTQAFVAADDRKIEIGMRGTELPSGFFGIIGALLFNPSKLRDIKTDLQFEKSSYRFSGKCHSGIMEAADSAFYPIISAVREEINNYGPKPVSLSGHSLGGALCLPTAQRLFRNNIKIEVVNTFGCPLFFDPIAAKVYDSDLGNITFRHVHNSDMVSRVPYQWMGFRHVGRLIYYDRHKRIIVKATKNQIRQDRLIGRLSDPFGGVTDHPLEVYGECR